MEKIKRYLKTRAEEQFRNIKKMDKSIVEAHTWKEKIRDG
jgi:hypothetical protein